jgi:oxalate decarboxylase
MRSKHQFDLKKGVKRNCIGGYRDLITDKVCPFLRNMALATIHLKKGGFREPHWHPNADEMTYCVEGKALVTFFSPGNIHDTFTLSAGEVMYVPRGYLHHIENIHSGPSDFVLAYNHSHPEDLDLSESVGSMSTHVLASTFSAKENRFAALKKQAKDVFIGHRKTLARPAKTAMTNPYKLNLERIQPQIETKGGSARIADHRNFPELEHLALFSLRIAKNGIREPHWHPNATELNLVIHGKARLTILSPGGNKDSFVLLPGQGSIIPTGYFHHIENMGPKELHMTVFFNHAAPNDIGLSGALSAYSPELLASLFSQDPKFFADLHRFQEDRMIVKGGG